MLLNDAVALAKKDAVDVVLAVVGLDERSESEALTDPPCDSAGAERSRNGVGEDRQAGGDRARCRFPVELPWFDDVAAMLYVGLSGQAGASATVRALIGEVNPSGHLAETWPMQYEDCPSSGWYPAIGRDAIYREGPFVGYRYYETVGVPVRFPFGYGLSYSTFTYSAITATATGVDFVVTNDSDVAGSTVAQLYVRAPQGGVLHPDRELKASSRSSWQRMKARACTSISTLHVPPFRCCRQCMEDGKRRMDAAGRRQCGAFAACDSSHRGRRLHAR